MFGNDRQALRRTFQDAWRKHCAREPLQPLEAQIADVIAMHPEYHRAVGDEASLDRDYQPDAGETNPFLHMAMHLALREQRSTDRPPGIAAALNAAQRAQPDAHAMEHAAMECLGQAMWEAQRAGTAPDEAAYLACVKRLGRRR